MRIGQDILASRGPAAAFAAMGLYWGGFAALVPDLKPQAGLTDEGFGLAMLVSTCGAVAAMWAAPVADRHLGRAAMPLLGLATALAFLTPGLATGWWGFALGMALAGAAVGCLDVVMNARLAALEATRGRPLMNLNHGLYSFVYAGSALVTGFAREAGAAPLAVFSGLGLVTLALVAVMATAPLVQDHAARAAKAAVSAWPLVLPGGLIVMIGFLTEQAAEGWSALHLERNLGAGAAAGSMGPALLGFTMGMGRLFGQVLAHRFPEPAVIRTGAGVAAVGALMAGFAPAVWVAYAGFAVLGLGASVIVPMAFAFVAARVPAPQRARAISRLSVIGYAGFFLGPPLMGVLSGLFGLGAAFGTVAVILALIPAALVGWMRRGA
ncbi:MAG: MFS transporter [Rhodobacteraceae bacterium]|uniref:MFS transporter n=1 Tax=Salipiger thiooxidans TaxID=282683 RepID=UPI001A8E31F1|nr:MFS transporter [Salipiger thiooxidans]MBN8186310.1 MFS transporter [Salipiger thiooxidans]MBR9836569.1 MFS transporter [Paracoccaceae bacterium]